MVGMVGMVGMMLVVLGLVGGGMGVTVAERKRLEETYPLAWDANRGATVFYGDVRDEGMFMDPELCGEDGKGEGNPLLARVCTTEKEAMKAAFSRTRGTRKELKMKTPSWLVQKIMEERNLKVRMANAHASLLWVRVGLPNVPEGDFPLAAFENLGPDQVVNRMPYMSTYINQKDNFADAVASNGFVFHPTTYVLPRDLVSLEETARESPEKLFIVKPVFGGRGMGISVSTGASLSAQILASQTSSLDDNGKDGDNDDASWMEGDYIVQEYIENPYLIEGRKFSMRLYVLVTSVAPLRVYVCREGIAKFASMDFETVVATDAEDPASIHAHITNNAANSHGEGFHISQDPDVDDEGSRRSLSGLRRVLRRQNVDVDGLFTEIHQVLLQSVLAVESKVREGLEEFVTFPNNTFQLLGVDVDLDADMNPKVIELNVNPSLGSHAAFELAHKRLMLHTLFDMVGVGSFDKHAYVQDKISPLLPKGVPAHVSQALADMLYEEDMSDGLFVRLYPNPETAMQYASYLPSPIDRAVVSSLRTLSSDAIYDRKMTARAAADDDDDGFHSEL